MVAVRFFGLSRLILKQSRVELEAANVDELLSRLNERYPQMSLQDLRNCVILVNGVNIAQLQIYRTRLKPGDEVHLFSPVAGG